MITITQQGTDFLYRNKRTGEQPIVETWGIERVAGFLFLIEWHRMRSQRYVKSFVFVAAAGQINYELVDFDLATNRDINKLTKLLVPYSGDEVGQIFYTTFDKGLDIAEELLKNKIKASEGTIMHLGKEIPLPKILTRPTREEYEAADLAQKQELMLQEANTVPGTVIKVWFANHGVLPCKIVDETSTWLFVDVYLNNQCIEKKCRIKKGSSRVRG